MDLLQIVRIIWRRRVLLMATVIPAAVLTFAVSKLFLPPVYEAKSRILIKSAEGAFTLSSTVLAQLGGGTSAQVGDYAEILKSFTLLGRAAKEVGLPSDPNSREFAKMKERVSVWPVPTTNMLEIRYQSKNPQEARDLVNSLVENLKYRSISSERRDALNSVKVMQDEIRAQENTLRDAEKALEEFKLKTGVIVPDKQAEEALAQIAQQYGLKKQAEVDLAESQTRLRRLTSELSQQEQEIVSSKVLSRNPVLAQLQQNLAAKEMELAALLKQYTDEHPSVITTRQAIEQLKEGIANQAEQLASTQTITDNPSRRQILSQVITLKAEVPSIEQGISVLNKSIAEMEANLKTLPAAERELTRLTREKLTAEQILAVLRQKEAEYRIEDEMNQGDIETIDPAFLPKRPVKPRALLNSAAAAFLTMIIVMLYLLFGEKTISLQKH